MVAFVWDDAAKAGQIGPHPDYFEPGQQLDRLEQKEKIGRPHPFAQVTHIDHQDDLVRGPHGLGRTAERLASG